MKIDKESTNLQNRAISNYLQPSSPGISWIPITTSTKTIPERDVLYSYPFGYLSPPSDSGIDRSSSQTYQDNNYSYGPPSPSSSSYSNAGYGEMQNSVAFSAMGLMSFLFFLRMITDTINSLNGGIITPITKRTERNIKDKQFEQSDSSLENLSYHIVQICIQLMDEERTECKPQQLCRINRFLVQNYGTVGLIAGTILSNTFIEFLYKTNEKSKIVYAASSRDGQMGNECTKYISLCSKPTSKEKISSKNPSKIKKKKNEINAHTRK